MDLTSPFIPGSDAVPQIWAGRELELADADRVARRRRAGVYERGRFVTGEFGIGKSVLLNRIAAEFSGAGDLVTRPVRIPKHRDPLVLLADAVADLGGGLGDRLGAVAGAIKQITLPVIGGGVTLRETPGTPEALLLQTGALLRELGLRALEDNQLLVLRIAEIQNADPTGLSGVLTVIGDALAETTQRTDPAGGIHEVHLPIIPYLSGLPGVRDQASQAGTTFSRRFRILELDPLEPEAMRTALAVFAHGFEVMGETGPVTVTMSQACIEFIVDRCLGDPFLFQLVGDAAWIAASSPAITEKDAGLGWQLVRREATDYVTGRYNRLGELQATYLSAAAQIEESERTAVTVAAALDRPTRQLGSTLEALLRRHRLLERSGRTLRFRSAAVERHLRGEWP